MDAESISRAYLRPIRSRPLPPGHIDLAGLGFIADAPIELPPPEDRWSGPKTVAFLGLAASSMWVVSYAFALGLLALGAWGLMLLPDAVRAV